MGIQFPRLVATFGCQLPGTDLLNGDLNQMTGCDLEELSHVGKNSHFLPGKKCIASQPTVGDREGAKSFAITWLAYFCSVTFLPQMYRKVFSEICLNNSSAFLTSKDVIDSYSGGVKLGKVLVTDQNHPFLFYRVLTPPCFNIKPRNKIKGREVVDVNVMKDWKAVMQFRCR